ncbi:MAG: NUDIX hydrolase [Candidatus Nomurabacteria bacterium]
MIYLEKPENFNPKFEVVSCFFKQEGKFLLLHRLDSKPQGDTWGVPAGKVEKGESSIDAICREIMEETGYNNFKILPELTHTIFVKYSDYDFIYYIYGLDIDKDYLIKIETNAHKGFRWVNKEEALKMNLIQDLDSCIDLYFK